MRKYWHIAVFSFLLLFSPLLNITQGTPSEPSPTILTDIRYWPDQNYTRVVLDLSNPAAYFDKYLPDPDRVYVDLHNTNIKGNPPTVEIDSGVVKQVRAGWHDKQTVRVVLELTGTVKYKVFPLTSPDRVVIDIYREGTVLPGTSGSKTRTIVIDPGHGGKDPGAIGRHGLMEKNIVLDVGHRLQRLIKDKIGAKVIMTREEDVFVPLEERTAIANRHGADLFISIHVNSSRRKGARGVETYLLGKATDKNAMDTAMRENSATEKSLGALQLILHDLLTTAKKEESLRLAHYVHGNIIERLEPRYKAVNLGVKQAPFFVLVNAGMPSILAEISFISNPDEERLLAKEEYRQEVAEAILDGIRKYIQSTPMLAQPRLTK